MRLHWFRGMQLILGSLTRHAAAAPSNCIAHAALQQVSHAQGPQMLRAWPEQAHLVLKRRTTWWQASMKVILRQCDLARA